MGTKRITLHRIECVTAFDGVEYGGKDIEAQIKHLEEIKDYPGADKKIVQSEIDRLKAEKEAKAKSKSKEENGVDDAKIDAVLEALDKGKEKAARRLASKLTNKELSKARSKAKPSFLLEYEWQWRAQNRGDVSLHDWMLENQYVEPVKRVNRQQRLVGWEEVERLQSKLDTLTELQEKMKAVNKIVRNSKLSEIEQHEELEALGLSARTINEVMAEPQYSFLKKGFQSYQLSNNLAKIKATEQAIKRHTAMATSDDKEFTFDGGKVAVCNSDERVRIYFDDIPDKDTRDMLKSNAFKWSPTNKAWQRQLTPKAMFTLKHYVKLPNLVIK